MGSARGSLVSARNLGGMREWDRTAWPEEVTATGYSERIGDMGANLGVDEICEEEIKGKLNVKRKKNSGEALTTGYS